MTQRTINTEMAPKAIGPYVQAVQANGLVFCSGQIAIDPTTGGFMTGATVQEQTHRVMKNLGAVLEAANLTLADVVKTTIYCTDLAKFKEINEVYGSYFEGTDPPARATIQVAALPLNADVEIECVATKG